MCEKEFSDSNFNQEVIGKISIFKKVLQISHINKSLNFSSIIVILLDKLLLPCKFYGSSMRGILFFNCVSSEPLTHTKDKDRMDLM